MTFSGFNCCFPGNITRKSLIIEPASYKCFRGSSEKQKLFIAKSDNNFLKLKSENVEMCFQELPHVVNNSIHFWLYILSSETFRKQLKTLLGMKQNSANHTAPENTQGNSQKQQH